MSILGLPLFGVDVFTIVTTGRYAVPCIYAPILEDLSNEDEGIVAIYKIDTDAGQALSGIFGIQSIPALLFIGADSEPVMQPGALPKHVFKKIIAEKLLASAAIEKEQE